LAVEERVRRDRASVYADVGVHADVEITVTVDSDGDVAMVEFGKDGPDLRLEVADLDTMERLAKAATEGARTMRDRMTRGHTSRRGHTS
jgi:hypothetical protein